MHGPAVSLGAGCLIVPARGKLRRPAHGAALAQGSVCPGPAHAGSLPPAQFLFAGAGC